MSSNIRSLYPPAKAESITSSLVLNEKDEIPSTSLNPSFVDIWDGRGTFCRNIRSQIEDLFHW